MIRFNELENKGLAIACLSERTDGDCGLRGESGDSLANRRRLCTSLGVDSARLVCAVQVHGARVAAVNEDDAGRGAGCWAEGLPDTDGLVTNVPGLPLAICVADCVPLYLYEPKRAAVGLIHCGREGLLKGIARVAVETMVRTFGCNPPDLWACVGPSAGPDRYEVSADLTAQWSAAGLPREGRRLNLWEGAAGQLFRAGVPRGHIAISGISTLAGNRFYSYRRGDAMARNMALAML